MGNLGDRVRNWIADRTRSTLRLPRLMLLLVLLLAGLGLSSPAQAQTATVSWDSSYVLVRGPVGPLYDGDAVDISTAVAFDFILPPGLTHASRPSGCNIAHDGGDSWRATITETCHVSGYDTPIQISLGGSTALVEGEFATYSLVAFGGDSPFDLTLEAGAVPTGMMLQDGSVSGTPSEQGSFGFTLRATNEYGHFATQAFTLTVAAAAVPTITSISPNTGPTTGGTTVIITGTNLTGATEVTFGGIAATINSVSATQIVATTPAGNAGTVNVAVTTPAGSVTAVARFTYGAPAATVSSVSVPSNGIYAAGQFLQFTVNFSEPVSVVRTPHLRLMIGDTEQAASYFVGSGTNALTFGYSIQEGDLDADGISLLSAINANGGSITGVGGTPANLTLNNVASTSGVRVDAVAPTVISSVVNGSPEPDADAVMFDVTFSERMNWFMSLSDLSLAATGSATGRIAAIHTSNWRTFFVLVNDISGTGSLRLDVVATGDLTDQAGNPMTASFTAGTPWVRSGSTDATLSSLAPSVGSLDPTFAPATTAYTLAVDSATDSIALTPNAADADATITVGGQTVASGNASPAITLAVGSTEIPVVVTAEDGTTTRTYTVTVERAQPVPIVNSRTIDINAGETASIDLTDGASGGPFTDAAIVDMSDAAAGTARIERDGSAYRLEFASSPTYAGQSNVRFTVSNSAGPSAPGTITFRVHARPDPSLDPEVIGLIGAQTETARRFANVQITNFSQRLEQLHNEGEQRSNSIGVDIGLQQSASPANAYAPRGTSSDDPALGAIEQAAPASDGPQSAPVENVFGDLAFWTGGYVNFGTNDNGAINLDHTLVGVSGGIDYRFTPELTAGLGIGYGRDVTEIGSNGTQSRAEAFSLAAYGSYRPVPGFFLDGLAGYGAMSFDSLRYVAATGDFASGTRSGDQFFGSLTAGYEYRDQGLLVSPYGRLSGSHSTLDPFTETGAGPWNLAYGEQSIDTLSATLGLRLAYDIPTDWGVLTPRGRLEYTHDFEGSSRASLGYADTGTTPFALEAGGASRDHLTLGLGLDGQIGENITFGLDYRTAFGVDGDSQDHTLGFKLGVQF